MPISDQHGRAPSTLATILIADGVPSNIRLLERLLVSEGYRVIGASDGVEAFNTATAVGPDLILTDVRMPRVDGAELCRRLKREPATRLTPIVLMTSSAEPTDRVRAIEAGADDFLTKPIDEAELKVRVKSLLRVKRFTNDLNSAEAIILNLALTVESRDRYTEGHCQRLAVYAVTIGKRLGLAEVDLDALHRGGYLHDLGKITIPDSILLKAGPLTEDERDLMKQHTVVGDRLCGTLPSMQHVRPIIRHHHELLDGTGYPDGLAGDDIPLVAQIMGIADVYDALTTERPYKPAYAPAEAYKALEEEVARGWRDPKLVKMFIEAGKAGTLARPQLGVLPR
jgi:putative two-component system response regulator